MKRILPILIIISFSIKMYGQESLLAYTEVNKAHPICSTSNKEKPAYKQTVYWGKYKVLKAAGWTSFSFGIAATTVGIFGGAIEEGATGEKPAVWDVIGYTGLGLFAASIPTLIVAYANKNKAYRVSLGADCITAPVVVGSNRKVVQPALALRFNF